MSPELVWWDEADGLSLTRRAPRGATPLTGAELRDPAVWPEVTALLTRLHRAALPDGYDCAPQPPSSPSALYPHYVLVLAGSLDAQPRFSPALRVANYEAHLEALGVAQLSEDGVAATAAVPPADAAVRASLEGSTVGILHG